MQSTTKRGIYVTFNGAEVARKELIRKLFIEGLEGRVRAGSRSDIVKFLADEYGQKVIFQQVYQATSDLESSAATRGRRMTMITLDSGEQIARRDLIKALFERGSKELGIPSNDRGAIVKYLKSIGHEVSFQIVYQATS